MKKEEIIAEIRRVAELLQTDHLSRREFSKHTRISAGTVQDKFGSWNEAIQSAGLTPIPQGPSELQKQQRYSDEELLEEIIHLTALSGKKPTLREISSKRKYSVSPFRERWGSLEKACLIAYAKYGFPQKVPETSVEEGQLEKPTAILEQVIVPQTYKPADSRNRKKVQFGEPIDFRGLRFAPINEEGVVFVFGMVSRELGFLIESLRTDYPDCEGKRCVDTKKQIWEHVLIEFEYRSGNFREHGHRSDDCDLIVCWIHDWQECPVEVLELKSQIKYLPNR